MAKNNPDSDFETGIILKNDFISGERPRKISMHRFKAILYLLQENSIYDPVYFLVRGDLGFIQFVDLFIPPCRLKFDNVLSIPLIKANFVDGVGYIAEISHSKDSGIIVRKTANLMNSSQSDKIGMSGRTGDWARR